MNEILHLCTDLDENQKAHIGGKGMGIHLLWKSGAKVPDSVCIPAAMNLETAVEAVLAHFKDHDETKSYAVRSSASIEDGKVKSYAGQFRSFLRVRGRVQLAEHCRRIRDLNSEEHRHLQSYAGTELKELSMHIVVQEVVEAEQSGVLFTCDPVSGSRSHIILERVEGTSEHLMDGSAAGERFVVHRGGSGKERAVPSPSHDAETDTLVCTALELEERLSGHFDGSPLDFEWAVKDGEPVWLQVRPVTALRRKTSCTIAFIREGEIPSTGSGDMHWTSINAREALPMVLTPLVSDMLVPFIGMGFTRMALLLGDKTEYRPAAVFDGRVFLNVTDLRKLTSRFPVRNPDSIMESFLSGRSAERAVLKLSPSLLMLFFPLLWKDLTLGRSYNAFIRKEEESWKYPDPDTLRGMTEEELKSKMAPFSDITEGFALHLMGSMRYMNVYSFLESICTKHDANPSQLVQGIGTPLFASAAVQLRDLLWKLKGSESLLFDADRTVRGDWKDRLESEPRLAGFREAFGRYMEKFGHLGDGSLDIYLRNNREEPEKVLKMLAGIMRSGEMMSGSEYLEKLSSRRREAVQRIRSKLSLPERIVFNLLVKVMHDSVHFRENIKFYFSRRADIFKVHLMELARRAVQKGNLTHDSDIFFLTLDELQKLGLPTNGDSLKSLIRERQKQFKSLQSLPCPLHRIEGAGSTTLFFTEKKEHTGTFKGVGASAGKAVGKVRIILDLHEGDRFMPGEILVTTATAPSWTPLFSLAGAVVVEIGSLLSHGAVVAREIGIPAVIGIPGIVEALHDGDLVAVDGSSGTVEVLESAETSRHKEKAIIT